MLFLESEICFKFNYVIIDIEGCVIVGDILGVCIYIFGNDGKVVSKFGKFGWKEGEF